jgi:diguanylate cyclase (GGDEF)-like protein
VGFESYVVPVLSAVERYYEVFAKNGVGRRRYLITTIEGAHLVGVPRLSQPFDRSSPNACFHVTTEVGQYRLPFSELAWAEELQKASLRPSDGMPPVPEPCRPPEDRKKHEKFRVLDSPQLLEADLNRLSDRGRPVALIYLDVDDFKKLNTEHTETYVDRHILPSLQNLVAEFTSGIGYAYAEGGDEMIVVLWNATTLPAVAFAEALRSKIESYSFTTPRASIWLTVSMGLAVWDNASATPIGELPQRANDAKKFSKGLEGKNCVSIDAPHGPRKVSLTLAS